jgi:hypothetical protein
VCAKIVRNLYPGAIWQGETEIPAEAQLLDKIMMDLERDLENQLIYGDRAGSPATAIDGLIKLLNDDTSRNVPSVEVDLDVPVDDPNSTGVDSVAQFEKLLARMPESSDGVRKILMVEPRLYDKYLRDYRDTYGAVTWNDGFIKVRLDSNEEIELVPVYALKGQNQIILAPEDQIVYANFGNEATSGYREREEDFWFRFRSYFGIQTLFGNQIIRGTWTPSP